MTTIIKRQAAIVIALCLALLLLVLIQTAVSAAAHRIAQDEPPTGSEVAKAIERAAVWLVQAHQNADGGFSSFSAGADQAPSDIGGTLDALWALGVSGSDTISLTAYLSSNAAQFAEYVAQDGSTAAKALLALAAEEDAASVGGLDLAANLTNYLSPTGQYGVDTAFNQSLAILALTFSGHLPDERATAWLADQQQGEGELAGSWDDGFGTAGNADSTALAIAALLAAGRLAGDPVIVAGREFLARTQLDTGGWEYGAGFGENANSTALAVLALAMKGEDLTDQDGDWAQNGRTPIAALLDWQGASGAFQADFGAGRSDDFFSTVQTVAALAYAQALLGGAPALAPVSEGSAEPAPTAAPADAADNSSVQAQDEGISAAWVWIIGVGLVVVMAALVWWLISKSRGA